MFRSVVGSVINIMGMTYDTMKLFLLERFPHITLFHFFLFLLFCKICLLCINYIKHIVDVVNEDDQWLQNQQKLLEWKEYQGWLRRNTK